jgi:uncharacterized protein with PIN domain
LLVIDGHNWMYPVVVCVIDSETNKNRQWFTERLKEAIATQPSLTFCIDCGKEVTHEVSEVARNITHPKNISKCLGSYRTKKKT